MIHAFVVLAQIVAFAAGAVHAAAESPVPAEGLEIDGTLDGIGNEALIEAIIAIAPGAPSADFDEATANLPEEVENDWDDVAQSGVAYPVTPSISLGVVYHLEEIEDLTAELIEMGTAGVDYTSHNVLVSAQWQFDLVLP